MDPRAMEPFGMALRAFFDGDAAAELIIRRDDGVQAPVPAGCYFRGPSEFSAIEKAAIDRCLGHVLDAGAGTGLHSLVLQREGSAVTAIDVDPQAASIMRQRGVDDVRLADVFELRGGPFDTLLMMGHGIGMVETLDGLDRFLDHARGLLSEDGQMLLHCLDPRVTDDPGNLAYHEANRRAGRYLGEIRIQVEFRGERGPYYGWLLVDAETLSEHAGSAGWRCEVVLREESGDYLARLTRQSAS